MKICLIGSTRFMEKFQEYNSKLTLAGHIVYSVALMTSERVGYEITQNEKEILDLVHLRKIQESEAVLLVTDETWYYGESTRRELRWATMIGRPVYLAIEGVSHNYSLTSLEDVLDTIKQCKARGLTP